MTEVAGLGDVILEQIPPLLQYPSNRSFTGRRIFEQLAVRLHTRPLSTCEQTILQSTAGVMGNLSSVREGVVGAWTQRKETVLTRHETILIHINTILKNCSVLESPQTVDM